MDRILPVRVRYAVIEVCDFATRPERFVVSYRSEKSLRETIVTCRIISSGFSSATNALESLNRRRLREALLDFVTKCRDRIQKSYADQAHRLGRVALAASFLRNVGQRVAHAVPDGN